MSSTAPQPASTASVPSQGGIIDGSNPSKYNPKDPTTLFIIQLGLILVMCHILHWPLSKIRQPRVIAEVVGGIILGPSVMGHIPGFRDAIFPQASIPNLTLVANVGLVLYLFLIGLETDVRFLVSNWRVASAVSFAGLALPFGLGCALAWGLYNQFRTEPDLVEIDFTTYMVFIGVAIAITAFPVLCRILTELRLLDTTAGVITLSAGVANDVIGWVLLALCVALANASSGILALWILLVAFGYLLFLLFAVKPALTWLLRRTGNIQNGPSQSIITLILLLTFASAFFTGIIGIHPIFGSFMAGLILPRENSFAIRVTEKLEDLIGALLLPLYFTLSGLNTDLGLLDNAITWGYVFAVTFTALLSKIFGATIAARLSGLVWRESLTIGSLMSCKGLVELIVLNIGLQAKILSTRTFTIFVVMALLTTFATTPLASFLYPPWYQKKLLAWKRGEIDWDTGEPVSGSDTREADKPQPDSVRVRRLLVYLRLDNMPAILNLVSLFGKEATPESEKAAPPAVKAHGLHLMRLTDRDSSVMTVSEVDEYTRRDPVVNIFRTVGQFLRVAVSGEVAVMPESRFADALAAKSSDFSSDLILVPWSESGSLDDDADPAASTSRHVPSYASFARSALDTASPAAHVAVFFPRGSSPQPDPAASQERAKLLRAYSFSDIHRDIPLIPVADQSHHVFLPFFGGHDDRLALALVVQMCEHRNASATVLHLSAAKSAPLDRSHIDAVSASLPSAVAARVSFESAAVDDPTATLLDRAAAAHRADSRGTTWHNLVVLGRRSADSYASLPAASSSVARPDSLHDCLGAHAALLVASKLKADLLVVQARAA